MSWELFSLVSPHFVKDNLTYIPNNSEINQDFFTSFVREGRALTNQIRDRENVSTQKH